MENVGHLYGRLRRILLVSRKAERSVCYCKIHHLYMSSSCPLRSPSGLYTKYNSITCLFASDELECEDREDSTSKDGAVHRLHHQLGEQERHPIHRQARRYVYSLEHLQNGVKLPVFACLEADYGWTNIAINPEEATVSLSEGKNLLPGLC